MPSLSPLSSKSFCAPPSSPFSWHFFRFSTCFCFFRGRPLKATSSGTDGGGAAAAQQLERAFEERKLAQDSVREMAERYSSLQEKFRYCAVVFFKPTLLMLVMLMLFLLLPRWLLSSFAAATSDVFS